MRLAGRLLANATLLVVALAAGFGFTARRELDRHLQDALASDLAREALLVAALVPPDSLAWGKAASRFARLLGHRVTLIDAAGRVRGDSTGDAPVGADLGPVAALPEVRQALAGGAGRHASLPTGGDPAELAVAVRAGPPGLAVVRVAAPVREDGAVAALATAILGPSVAALLLAGLAAGVLARSVTRPLAQLAPATRAIAAGEAAAFPTSQVRELSAHILAVQTMSQALTQRFAELRRDQEETQTLIESMADGVLATDANGAIVTVNTAARRMLGFRAGQPPPLAELFHDKRARDLVRAALDGHDIDQHELELDGQALLVTARPLPNGGALLVLRDVTALRRLEAVRRDFVANVSHELKTPLTSIAGYAETLVSEARANAQAQGFAETILSNARRMHRLVDDLLDLSRIESGSWQPTRRVVDIAALARETWLAFSDRARGQEIAFAVDVAPGAATLAIDPDAFRQIFTNLYDNALRHTPRGGAITVGARDTADGILVFVRDTGSGILPEHLPRIFERFYRADAGRARAQGGTGLGLAIVKHLAEAHGGRAAAVSTLGEGTTIELVLPGAAALS